MTRVILFHNLKCNRQDVTVDLLKKHGETDQIFSIQFLLTAFQKFIDIYPNKMNCNGIQRKISEPNS